MGVHNERIGITSGNMIAKYLPLNLTVTGKLPDGWTVNPADFESNMTITGRIKFMNVFQTDPADILAAFIGDTCVGLTSPIKPTATTEEYYTFLTVYGNAVHSGLPIKLKYWDAGTGNVYSVIETTAEIDNSAQNFTFAVNAMHGTALHPMIHDVKNMIEQRIALVNGWNWFSVNVTNTNPTIMEQFKERIGTAGDLLKSRSAYSQGPLWLGALGTIAEEEMYALKTTAAKTLTFDGTPANPALTPITLNQNWNWIGYVPQFTLPVSEALSNLTATPDDQIKGQSSYRIYDAQSSSWVGTLNYMRAGEGYLYYSKVSTPVTFFYPSSASQLYRAQVQLRSSALPIANRWTPDVHKFANSMTMTSVVLEGGVEVQSELLEIGAFAADGECRGSIMLQHEPQLPAHQYLGFLMVFGEEGDKLTFKVYDHATDREYTASNVESFEVNAIHGTLYEPYKIRSLTTGTELTGGTGAISVYPNPVEDKLTIKNFATAGIEKVTITDLTGRTLYSSTSVVENYIDVSDYTSGVYVIRFTCSDGAVTTLKFVKK
jgi:hypothetical protein